jgi:hypothetical protein
MLVAFVEDIGFEPTTFPQHMRDALAVMEAYKIKKGHHIGSPSGGYRIRTDHLPAAYTGRTSCNGSIQNKKRPPYW